MLVNYKEYIIIMSSHATCSRHHMTEKIFAHIKQHSINQASKILILLRFLIVHPTEIFSRVSMRGRDMKGEYLVFLWGGGIWKGNILYLLFLYGSLFVFHQIQFSIIIFTEMIADKTMIISTRFHLYLIIPWVTRTRSDSLFMCVVNKIN